MTTVAPQVFIKLFDQVKNELELRQKSKSARLPLWTWMLKSCKILERTCPKILGICCIIIPKETLFCITSKYTEIASLLRSLKGVESKFWGTTTKPKSARAHKITPRLDLLVY